MTDEKLIADQARKIADLEEELSGYKEADNKIYNLLYSIGAPLNDNKLGYTKEQLTTFFKISNQLNTAGKYVRRI